MPPDPISSDKTKKTTKKHDYIEYKDSGLGRLLSELLHRLAIIRKKYPLSKHKTPAELEALGLLNATETIIAIAHQSVLPKFSKGVTPSIWSFLPSAFDFLRLLSIKKNIHIHENTLILFIQRYLRGIITRARADQSGKSLTDYIIDELETMKPDMEKQAKKIDGNDFEVILSNFKSQIRALNLENLQHLPADNLANVVIHHLTIELNTPRHPMSYELYETLAEFMQNAPPKAVDLVNFLNPAAIPEMIANTDILSKELRSHGTTSVNQRIPEPDSTEHPYRYDVVSSDPHQHGLWDMEEKYTYTRAALFNQMIGPAIRRYLAKWGERDAANNEHAREAITKGTRRVKSDVARAALLQTFKHQELALINAFLSSPDQPELTPLTKLEGMVSITAISERVKALEAYLQDLHSILRAIENRRCSYTIKSVHELLQEEYHQPTQLLLTQHHEQGLDVEYCTKPIPEDLIYVTEGVLALPSRVILVKKELDARLRADVRILEADGGLAEGLIAQLSDKAIALWKQEQAPNLQKWLELQQQFRTLEENPQEKTESIYAANTEKRVLLQEKTRAYIATIKENIPDVGRGQLSERFQCELSILQRQADQFIEELTKSQETADRELHVFQAELERIRTESVAQENIRTIEPTQLRIDIELILQSLEQLHARKEAMKTNVSSMKAERDASEESLTRISAKIETTALELDRIQVAYHAFQPTLIPLKARKIVIEQTCMVQSTRDLYVKFQTILPKIKVILENDLLTQASKEKPKISFNKIDKEISPSKIGFNELLDLIESLSHIDKEMWVDYRSRQNDFGRFNPKGPEFHKMVKLLCVLVESTHETISEKLKAEEVLCHEFAQLNEALEPKLLKESAMLQCQTALEQEQTTNFSERAHLQSFLADRTAAVDGLTHELAQLDVEDQQQNNALTILQQFTELHIEMQALTLKLQAFIQNGGAQLAQRITEIKLAEQGLRQKLNVTRAPISTLRDPQEYERKYAGMQQLLDKISHDIAREIECKLDQQVLQFEKMMADDKRLYDRQWQRSTQLLPEKAHMFTQDCRDLSQAVGLDHRAAILFKEGLQSVEENISASMRQRMDNLCNSTQASGLITMVDDLLAEGLATARRIDCVQYASKALDAYMLQRHAKYKVKDFFSSKDKMRRQAFIHDLKQQLEGYKLSPMLDKQLLKTIGENMSKFPGIGLRTVLNQITVAILDSKNKSMMEKDEKAGDLLHGQARGILIALEKSHAAYVTRVRDIDLRIQEMKAYGELLSKKHDKTANDVITIAMQLQNQIDLFIVQQGEELPKKESFDAFSQKFIATLHSRDNVMSEHGSALWLNIIANILLSLFLIPKLIFSKVKTGRCSFFCETTAKIEKIQSIEESAQELKGEYSKENAASEGIAIAVC